VYYPRAFAQKAKFEAKVAEVASTLGPDVVRVIPRLGEDWREQPAVFFMVILSDAAVKPLRDAVLKRDGSFKLTGQVSSAIEQQVQPLEEWDVFPYFNFRSASEQAKIDEAIVA
jgi:hypothetical protein